MEKTLDYYVSLPYRLEIIPDDVGGGFYARYPELPGCITYGTDMTQLIQEIEDAKSIWLACMYEDGHEIPEPKPKETTPVDEEVSGRIRLRVPKDLHRALKEHAREQGVTLNQYCTYLLTLNDVREELTDPQLTSSAIA